MKNEPNVLNLKPPIAGSLSLSLSLPLVFVSLHSLTHAVFGDIHGQYYDLVNILSKAGKLENMNMLFLGDYVDRGTFGCEVIFLSMAYVAIGSLSICFSLSCSYLCCLCCY